MCSKVLAKTTEAQLHFAKHIEINSGGFEILSIHITHHRFEREKQQQQQQIRLISQTVLVKSELSVQLFYFYST